MADDAEKDADNGNYRVTRLRVQVDIVLNELAGSAAYPPDLGGGDELDYLYREGVVLVRDADVARVLRVLDGGEVKVHALNVGGLTVVELPPGISTVEACERLDRELGVGVATPDHVFYVCPRRATCPATEPEEVRSPFPEPDPAVSSEQCDGAGVSVSVMDGGWLPEAAHQHEWLRHVTGEAESPLGPDGNIRSYAGHGTFVAGVLRSMAPKAHVHVKHTFVAGGAIFESDLAGQMAQVLQESPDIISMSWGMNTRKDVPPLSFDVLERRIRAVKGLVLVAAAGNDDARRPFWPAALPWVVSVGALSTNWRKRAWFSNYGGWVDVYAPGEDLVNAFASGPYVCQEPPHAGEHRDFDGMAQWSGTSFSTPLVAGLIAARMSVSGENGRQAAGSLLARARAQAIPGVGAVIFPGQACDDRARCRCRASGGCGCGCGGCGCGAGTGGCGCGAGTGTGTGDRTDQRCY